MSSRQPRGLDPCSAWVSALRAALLDILSHGYELQVATGTTHSDLITRGASRRSIPTTVFCHSVVKRDQYDTLAATAESRVACLVSDKLAADPHLRDKLVVERSAHIYLIALRREGTIHGLLKERLVHHQSAATITTWDHPRLLPRSLHRWLGSLGAHVREVSFPLPPTNGMARRLDDLSFHTIDQFDIAQEWLVHTTRACPGPWIGQELGEYLDRVLDNEFDAAHTVQMTLNRILAQSRLRASNRNIRGGFHCVCFTLIPLPTLRTMRQYRHHLMRWDFEPYGIAINPDVLIRYGARSVSYGSEQDWNDLDEHDRPWFQIARGPQSDIDWTVEREWRLLGDLQLDQLEPDDALVLVPSAEAVMNTIFSLPFKLVTINSAS